MKNIKLTAAYDGGNYLGWQKTKEGPSIENALQTVLELILQESIHLQAASRTDAGVHADEQVINFLTAHETLNFDRLMVGINSLLEKDIVVTSAQEAPLSFHPTLDCQLKEYHYWICCNSYQLPQNRRYSWHLHHALDVAEMRRGASFLQGERDYTSFCNIKKNEPYAHHVREVKTVAFIEHPNNRLQVIIKGSRFLYKMVRNMVGTLVEVGKGKMQAQSVKEILDSRDRTKAGPTAPAHGLFLHRINY